MIVSVCAYEPAKRTAVSTQVIVDAEALHLDGLNCTKLAQEGKILAWIFARRVLSHEQRQNKVVQPQGSIEELVGIGEEDDVLACLISSVLIRSFRVASAGAKQITLHAGLFCTHL